MTLEEEITAAERKLRQPFDALMAYWDRPDSETHDFELHQRLADGVNLASARYVTLLSRLKS